MKFKFTPLTIFLILLTILILSVIVWNILYKVPKEGFISFQNNNQATYGTLIYIPQYTEDTNRKVYSLYDNIFFDPKNGNLIEVDATSCSMGTIPAPQNATNCSDNVGTSIARLYVAPREGNSFTVITPQPLNKDGTVVPYTSYESLRPDLQSNYTPFLYSTKSLNTDNYQVFYIGFDKQTFIHIIDIEPLFDVSGQINPSTTAITISTNPDNTTTNTSSSTTTTNPSSSTTSTTGSSTNNKSIDSRKRGNNIITYLFEDKILGKKSFTNSELSDYTVRSSTGNEDTNNGNCNSKDDSYQSGKVSFYQITPTVKFDFQNGYIMIKNTGTSGTSYDLYERATGKKVSNPSLTGSNANVESFTSYIVPDGNNGNALIMVYGYQTVIGIINVNPNYQDRKKDKRYEMKICAHFNEFGSVTSGPKNGNTNCKCSGTCNCTDPTTSGTTGTSKPSTIGIKSTTGTSKPSTTGIKSTTGTSKPSSTSIKLTTTNIPTDISGLSGNKYSKVCGDDLSCKWYWYFHTMLEGDSNSYTNNNMFTRDYIKKTEIVPMVSPTCPNCTGSGTCSTCGGNGGSGTMTSTGTSLTGLTPLTPPVTGASRTLIDGSGNTQKPSTASTTSSTTAPTTSNSLYSKQGNGEFSSNANPDTLGGAAVLMTYSSVSGIEGVAKTAGNTVTKTFDTAGNVLYKITDAGGNIINRTFDTAGKLIDSSVGLAKDVGSGISSILTSSRGASGQGVNSSRQNNENQLYGPQTTNPISDSRFGNIAGSQTPIDNYSHYGALQSKGSGYMPITADFSSFRR